MNKATKGFVYATSCLAVLGALTLGQPRHVEAATGLQLTSSYVKSAQSLQTAQGRNNIESSSWRQNMLQVTHQNWQGNHYEMSEQDQQRVVDPANLTSSQSAELNQYAMELLNQVKTATGDDQRLTKVCATSRQKLCGRQP